MSDERKDDTPPYSMPEASARERMELRDTWAKERAEVAHQILARVPAEDQPYALYLFGCLERLHVEHADNLQRAWRRECDRAYASGQQAEHGTLKALDEVGTGTATDTDTPPTRH